MRAHACACVQVLYAAVTGTCATGAWVIAHECGHDAFCDQETRLCSARMQTGALGKRDYGTRVCVHT